MCLIAFSARAGWAAIAQSQTYPLSVVIFRIEVESVMGRSSYQAEFESGSWDPVENVYTWEVADVDLISGASEWLGTLTNASLFVRAAQMGEIELNIGVISGPAETHVRIMSPLVKYADRIPASFARGRAVASITLTDGEGDGALIIGQGTPGTGIFRSYYNGFLTDGDRFTHLVSSIQISQGGGTATASQYDPLVGFRPIGEEIVDISSEIAFTVSPMDLAYAFTTMDYPEAPPCPGDLDDDGVVALPDLSLLLSAFETCQGSARYIPEADFDESGCIDIHDLAAFLSYYGHVCW